MRVLIVRHYRPDAQRSMLEFGQAVYDYMVRTGQDVRSIEPRPRLGKGRNTMSGQAKVLGYLDKFVLFPQELRRAARNADVVHLCGQQHALYIRHLGGKPSLLTCHDLLAVRASLGEMQGVEVGGSGQKLQAMIRDAMPQATHIACVSTATLDDLEKYCRLRPGQASVVLNGVYEHLEPTPAAEAAALVKTLGLEPGIRFLFHIGGNTFYKNRPGVIRIFGRLNEMEGAKDLKLVMAGQPFTPEMRSLVTLLGLEGKVIEARDVNFETKVALYSKAYALLFPSTAEGFGLPIIEAQMCGCPVITSDIPPMDEVAGDAALMIDPKDEAGAAEKIAKNLASLPLLVHSGHNNVKRFDLDRMGADYVAEYRKLSGSGPGA
jgi:glycosyltransferase involved in cell wall biosynthesis